MTIIESEANYKNNNSKLLNVLFNQNKPRYYKHYKITYKFAVGYAFMQKCSQIRGWGQFVGY